MDRMNRRSFIKKGAAFGAALGLSPMMIDRIWAAPANIKRKIYIFSKHLQWLDYPDMAKTTREIGFDGVDLTVRPKGHVLPENVERDLPGAIEEIRKQGLTADTITTAITGIQDPLTEKIIKTAAELGIKQYRMGWINYDPALDIPANLENFRVQMNDLAQMNEKYQIRGDYQNHAGVSLGGVIWDVWHILKSVDSPWLGARYDIRHAVVEGTMSWPVTLKLIAPYIRSLDIKDFAWQNDSADPIVDKPLGEGIVDFTKYFGLLSEYNIPGNMTMHFEYPLGGAENGSSKLTVDPKVVITALKNDLEKLRTYLEA